jgi:hypothetical protein
VGDLGEGTMKSTAVEARPLSASPPRTCAQAVVAAECVKAREQAACKHHVSRNKKPGRSSKSSVCSDLGRCACDSHLARTAVANAEV